MKRAMVILCAIVVVFGSIGIANATLVDFESTGFSEGDLLTNQITGLTFTNALIAEEGGPRFAFSGYPSNAGIDMAAPGESFGGFFVTDHVVDGDVWESQIVEILFHIPVVDLSFRVADLDFLAGGPEILTAQTFDEIGTLLETIIVTAGDSGTGDGIATLVDFSAKNISTLTIEVADSRGRAGWGVDNISFTPVPEPATMLLLASGLAGLAAFRKRFKNR